MLAVVRDRLYAFTRAYTRGTPQRYRAMFGGVWMTALHGTSVTKTDVFTLGDNCVQLITSALTDCVDAGVATSTDPHADTIALWLGLHGMAHQKAVTVSFPWPPDIADRITTALAHIG
jgi:hypothetical protein